MEKGEWRSIIIAIILATALFSFNNNILDFDISYFIIPLIIITVFVTAQKVTANYIDVAIEIKTWELKRFWYTTWAELKKAAPLGIILPLLLGFLSGGMIKMLALLQFHATELPSKVAKKYGIRRIMHIMEWDDALVGFYGILSVCILAIVSSKILPIFISSTLFSFASLAKFSLYYAIWNLVPLSKITGSKIFFGSRPLYFFTLILTFLTGMIVFY
jgi:hypothetical protein